jgi:hypothetical protein
MQISDADVRQVIHDFKRTQVRGNRRNMALEQRRPQGGATESNAGLALPSFPRR